MKVFKIEYVETQRAYFGVEAETEEQALERFEEWRMNSDYVYDVIQNSDNIDSDTAICDYAYVYKEDILTDEMYQRL